MLSTWDLLTESLAVCLYLLASLLPALPKYANTKPTTQMCSWILCEINITNKTLNFPAEHFSNLFIPLQTLICTREHFVNLLIQIQQLKCTDSHLL